MKKILLPIITLVLLAVFVSCTTFKNKQAKVEFILKGNATTGYLWSAIPDNSGIYEIIKEDYTPDQSKPGMAGAGGLYHAVIAAVKQGTGSIKFVYKRAWEDSPIEERIYSVTVDENQNIFISKIQSF